MTSPCQFPGINNGVTGGIRDYDFASLPKNLSPINTPVLIVRPVGTINPNILTVNANTLQVGWENTDTTPRVDNPRGLFVIERKDPSLPGGKPWTPGAGVVANQFYIRSLYNNNYVRYDTVAKRFFADSEGGPEGDSFFVVGCKDNDCTNNPYNRLIYFSGDPSDPQTVIVDLTPTPVLQTQSVSLEVNTKASTLAQLPRDVITALCSTKLCPADPRLVKAVTEFAPFCSQYEPCDVRLQNALANTTAQQVNSALNALLTSCPASQLSDALVAYLNTQASNKSDFCGTAPYSKVGGPRLQSLAAVDAKWNAPFAQACAAAGRPLDTCVAVRSTDVGQYKDAATCAGQCNKWKCDGTGTIVPSTDGTGRPDSEKASMLCWKCQDSTSCVVDPLGYGQFATQSECTAVCSRYKCDENGQVVKTTDPNGRPYTERNDLKCFQCVNNACTVSTYGNGTTNDQSQCCAGQSGGYACGDFDMAGKCLPVPAGAGLGPFTNSDCTTKRDGTAGGCFKCVAGVAAVGANGAARRSSPALPVWLIVLLSVLAAGVVAAVVVAIVYGRKRART